MQVSDAPGSRIREAVSRARRNVDLNDDGPARFKKDAMHPHSLSTVLQPVSRSNPTQEEFDRQFIEAARAAFGEGFVPMDQLPGDLGDRVRHIVTVTNQYARDFILDQMERMLVAKVPMDTIAARFRVGINTVYKWRSQLTKQWAERARALRNDDAAEQIGKNISAFELRIAMGMQMAQKANATLNEISRGLEIAERAHVNLIKYKEMLGYFDDKPLAKTKDATNGDDDHVKKAKQLTNDLQSIMAQVLENPVVGDMGDDGGLVETEYSKVG